MKLRFLNSRVQGVQLSMEETALRGLDIAVYLAKKQALQTGENLHWELYHKVRDTSESFRESDINKNVSWTGRVKTTPEIEREIERIR